MDIVTAQATNAALDVVEAYFQDADSRREAARRVAKALDSQALLRVDEQDFGSRPKW